MIRPAVLAVLLLGSAGCSTLQEARPFEGAGAVGEDLRSQGAVAALDAGASGDEAEFGDIVEPMGWDEAPREPLKDLLLAAPASEPTQRTHFVKAGDTLGSIADRYRVTIPMLKGANRLDSDRIRVGQKLRIPAVALRIEIDKSDNVLKLFKNVELVRTYPVATGDQGVTPVGSYTIANRLIGPTWYWQGHAVPADDPEYPLGSRWLGLSRRGYGIHGTNEPESIGKQVSHGCIRMHNEDVEELFDVVAIGTGVTIVE
jgi:lipoprotein-anchoring transpeptidase ErfK/SrfK